MWADLFVASRSLRRSPIFAATAIATLALGIGASSAVFSIVHAVLLRPLPFRDPGQWSASGRRTAVMATSVRSCRPPTSMTGVHVHARSTTLACSMPSLIQQFLGCARVSPATLGFSVAVAFLAAVVTGLIPALRHSRTDLQSALTADGERSTGVGIDIRLQRLIVAGELAVCLVLLVGAMLFAQTSSA